MSIFFNLHQHYKQAKVEAKKQGKQDDGISLQKEVLNLTERGYWKALLEWRKHTELLIPDEYKLVNKASTLQGFAKINIEKDWRKLLEVRKKCEDEGFRV